MADAFEGAHTVVHLRPIYLQTLGSIFNEHFLADIAEGDAVRIVDHFHERIHLRIVADGHDALVKGSADDERMQAHADDERRAAEFADPAHTDKASLLFTLPHTRGSLSKVLTVLSFYDINLTKIQSLPIIGREWEYRFYVDVTFDDPMRYRQAIDAARPLTSDFRILGEYAECPNPAI